MWCDVLWLGHCNQENAGLMGKLFTCMRLVTKQQNLVLAISVMPPDYEVWCHMAQILMYTHRHKVL